MAQLRIGRFIEAPIESEVDPQVRDAWEQASRRSGPPDRRLRAA
jgi:hypothetical protein